MKITFSALMKKLEIKSLQSLDKGGRLTLDFNVYKDETISGLNALMKADEEVRVTISDDEK